MELITTLINEHPLLCVLLLAWCAYTFSLLPYIQLFYLGWERAANRLSGQARLDALAALAQEKRKDRWGGWFCGLLFGLLCALFTTFLFWLHPILVLFPAILACCVLFSLTRKVLNRSTPVTWFTEDD